MDDEDMRFAGLTGKAYDLMILAHPHFPELQKKIGGLLSNPECFDQDRPLKVLEIGCGDGYTTRLILSCRDKLFLTAIDNEPVMIEGASTSIESMTHQNKVMLVEADALVFLQNVSQGEFDAVVSAMTYHNWHVDYRHNVLREIHRVLRSGGFIINADKYFKDPWDHNRALKLRISKYFEVFTRLNRYDILEEWVLHELEDANPDRLMPANEATAFLERVGFKNIEIFGRASLEAVLYAHK